MHVRGRRRARRALLRDARDGRLLHAPPPQLRQHRDRVVPRLHRHRATRRGAPALRARPPRLPHEQGPGAGAAGDDRRRPRRGARRDDGHLPVSGRHDRSSHVCAGLGAGRRPRRRRRTVSGPVAPRAHPRRARGNGLRRPARLARRLGADRDLGRAEGAEPPLRRHDRGRGGRTGGKAADRPLLRALRRRRARCLHDHPHRQRGERPDDHDPPGPHGGQRRDSRRRAASPARLGHVSALSGRVRARARHPLVGRGDPEVHVPGGPAARRARPRTAAAGHGGRPRLPGPRDGARHRRPTRIRSGTRTGSPTWPSTAGLS